jgi:YbgC/YbaW family acyl-CoA thioester hydrolase
MEPYRRKVRYWDVDANAHVFNARYFVYFDDAVTDFFDEVGMDLGSGEGVGPVWVIAHAECDFKGEAMLGAELATSVSVDRIGTTSVTFGLLTIDEPTGKTVAIGREVYVTIDRETRRPTAVPDNALAALRPYLGM